MTETDNTEHTIDDMVAVVHEEEEISVFPNAIYLRAGTFYIAVDDLHLVPLEIGNTVQSTAQPGDRFVATRGTTDWVTLMVSARAKLARALDNEMRVGNDLRTRARQAEQRIEDIGNALIEKANDHNWCSEYDEFAEEWDLPRRTRDYEVCITVTVRANSEEAAEELVDEHVSFQMYDEGLVDGPHIDITEA